MKYCYSQIISQTSEFPSLCLRNNQKVLKLTQINVDGVCVCHPSRVAKSGLNWFGPCPENRRVVTIPSLRQTRGDHP